MKKRGVGMSNCFSKTYGNKGWLNASLKSTETRDDFQLPAIRKL